MRVLTVNPIEAFWIVRNNQLEPLHLRLNSLFRGDLLLACTKIKPAHVQEYVDFYQKPTVLTVHPMLHPVEWAKNWPVASSIFAQARLVRVESEAVRDFRYTFADFNLIDPIPVAEVRPLWWFFDLDKRQPIDFFPLSEENIRYFYQLCEAIDSFRDYDADFFVLGRDPRARAARKGILRKLRSPHSFARRWAVIKSPRNWRAVFAARFGADYVPYNRRGQNYIHLKREKA